jgi:hypothetical protein
MTTIVFMRKAKKSRRHQTRCAAAASIYSIRQLLVSRRTTPLVTHSDFAENGECNSLANHLIVSFTDPSKPLEER